MKYTFHLLLVVLVSPVVFSCKKQSLFSTGSKKVTSDRAVSSFTKILLYNKINLILTQDTMERIKVEADEDLLTKIITEVKDNTLTIKGGNGLTTRPDAIINVYVSVKDLQELGYQGAGTVSCTDTLKTTNFSVYSNDGAGDVHLLLKNFSTNAGIYNENADFYIKGEAEKCNTYCSSRGTIDFSEFSVKYMNIDYSSIRDGYISVSDVLHASIYYKGNLYYKGSPEVNVQTYNEGKLIPR
jgi:hypothetical protein